MIEFLPPNSRVQTQPIPAETQTGWEYLTQDQKVEINRTQREADKTAEARGRLIEELG